MIDEHLISLVDDFLKSEDKVLDGFQPHWHPKAGYKEFQLSWPILEERTGISRAKLRFRLPFESHIDPSISLVFGEMTVCRLDRAKSSTRKRNPAWAWRIGLAPFVEGTHLHGWEENKANILATQQKVLGARTPLSLENDSLDGMFVWFCDHINVRFQSEHIPLVKPDGGLWSFE